jgi:Rieske Fe-S protein
MSEEVQERVEDYLGLERYIEQLRTQRSAHLPDNLAPQQTRIYGMALLFHTAIPRVADPRPEFTKQLGQRLREQLREEEQFSGPTTKLPRLPQDKKQSRTIFRQNQASQPTSISPNQPESRDAKKGPRQDAQKRTEASSAPKAPFSRRKLGAIAAEILVTAGVGTGAGAIIEHASAPQATPSGPQSRLGKDDWPWHPVASVEQLGKEALPFKTETITGYLIRQTDNSTEPIIALSGACTHLGCLVQWQQDEREFVCPCHGSSFGATGNPSPQNRQSYAPLPRLDTKTENGTIYVKVPPRLT